MKRHHAAAFGIGALFAVGLAVSGMTKPSKVSGFLDLAGAWDASLAFVMAGAIGVHLVAYRFAMRRTTPLFDEKFHVPTRKDIDLRLVAGAALFGIGWALAGFCPGPALVSLGSGSVGAFVFVAGMTLGMFVEQLVSRAAAGPGVHEIPLEPPEEPS